MCDLLTCHNIRQWRCVRIRGIIFTLTLQNLGSKELRFTPDALLLTAAMVWLTNGLHSRPDDGSAARDLMYCVMPLTDDLNEGIIHIQAVNDGDEHPVPTCSFGAYFVRDIVLPPIADVPRMVYGQVLNNASFKFLFGRDFFELHRINVTPAYLPRDRGGRRRVGTQKGMSKCIRVDSPEPLEAFNDLEMEFPQPQQDIGEDLPIARRMDPLLEDMEDSVPKALTKHWLQFCSDLLQKCGNMRNRGLETSHCRMSMEGRISGVTPDTFKDDNLALVFNQVQWKKASRGDWIAAFDIFFPPVGAAPRIQPQNFPTMLYWVKWADMKMHLPRSQVNRIRNKYWELFNELQWVPRPHYDRLWKYTVHEDFQALPNGWKLQAPQVLMHPRARKPLWETAVDEENEDLEMNGNEEEEEADDHRDWIDPWIAPIPRHILLREEEEESSGSD